MLINQYFLFNSKMNLFLQLIFICIYSFSTKSELRKIIFIKLPLPRHDLARIACSWYSQCRLSPPEIDRSSLLHPHCCPIINHFKFIQNCQYRPKEKLNCLLTLESVSSLTGTTSSFNELLLFLKKNKINYKVINLCWWILILNILF